MSHTDPTTQIRNTLAQTEAELAKLQSQSNASSHEIQQLEQAIVKLKAALLSASQGPSQQQHDQRIDNASVGVAVAGGVHGDVHHTNYYFGQPTSEQPAAPVLAHTLTAYLYGDEQESTKLEQLALLLRLRGVRVSVSTAFINQHQVKQAHLVVLWLTADLLEEEHELEQLQSHCITHQLPCFVLHQGLRRRDLLPYRGEYHNQINLALGQELVQIAGTIVEQTLERYRSHLVSATSSGLKLGLYTRNPGGQSEEPTLFVDWRAAFQPVPSPEQWQRQLLPALHDLRRSLGANAITQIDLSANAALSSGLALGYAFRETTSTQFRIRQRDEWWLTAPCDPQAQPFGDIQPIELSDAADISVELSIKQPRGKVSGDAQHYLAQNQIAVGLRLVLEWENNLRESDAQAMASQVRCLLQECRRRRPQTGTIHLFMAVPFALAVMIGWHLNTLTPIQTYERAEGAHAYTPSCLLNQL
jgi:hypothetical protein